MTPADVIHDLPLTAWDGPFPPDLRSRALAALEAGRVILCPALPFTVRPDETAFLNPAVGDDSRKNVSLDPATGKLGATSLAQDEAARLAGMMQRFSDQAQALLHGLFPIYAPALERARTSFRPTEIAGRQYTRRHDDTRLHVDAFPSRPMAGRRILRVFSNVADDGSVRKWKVGEPFGDFAPKFLPRLKPQAPGVAWAMRTLGLTKARRTAYDHLMLSLHDEAKFDAAYQATAPQAGLDIPAGATWFCFTDQVLHAALAGHCCLEQTFHLPVEAMAEPERSPLRVLEGLAGRRLAA
ncbi:MAG TPA: Kdo hydroxylase family protein [Caulobacteraceae bacterium]|nr:Kdo hydroxylase family protein [Caulobacteraceae bacterium]